MSLENDFKRISRPLRGSPGGCDLHGGASWRLQVDFTFSCLIFSLHLCSPHYSMLPLMVNSSSFQISILLILYRLSFAPSQSSVLNVTLTPYLSTLVATVKSLRIPWFSKCLRFSSILGNPGFPFQGIQRSWKAEYDGAEMLRTPLRVSSRSHLGHQK